MIDSLLALQVNRLQQKDSQVRRYQSVSAVVVFFSHFLIIAVEQGVSGDSATYQYLHQSGRHRA